MSNIWQYQAGLVRLWTGFYREKFGINLKEVLLPEPKPFLVGKWLIIRVPSLSASFLINRMRQEYDVFVWTGRNLDKVLDRSNSVRSAADRPYGIWVEPGEEPDKDLIGKSGNELKYLGVTIEERLLLDYFHWLQTRRHLDIFYRTLCTGSTYDTGGIPCMGWHTRNNQLIVDGCFLPDNAYAELCGRKVIAAPEIPSLGAVYH